MKLEVCANSYQSALNAQSAGADRIELCSELSVGGITPSYGLLRQVLNDIEIPVFVLIRPRSGDFFYSDDEFEIMKTNINLCKDLGCSGIVSGVLHEDNSIDIERTKTLIELSKPLPFTFHRAFDCVPDPLETLKQLINLGVERVLTSGQEVSAEQGINTLMKLMLIAEGEIIILPGGGITSENALLFKTNGFKEIHASATKVIQKNTSHYFGDTIQLESDVNTIKSILKHIKK